MTVYRVGPWGGNPDATVPYFRDWQWTASGGYTLTIVGGKLRITTNGTQFGGGTAFYILDQPNGDVDVRLSYTQNRASGNIPPIIGIRGGTLTQATQTGANDRGYSLVITSSVTLYRCNIGLTSIGTCAWTPISTKTNVRFRAQANRISMKIWDASTVEPAAWMIDVEDTPASGINTPYDRVLCLGTQLQDTTASTIDFEDITIDDLQGDDE